MTVDRSEHANVNAPVIRHPVVFEENGNADPDRISALSSREGDLPTLLGADRELVRAGMRAAIDAAEGLRTVGEASVTDVVSVAARLRPRVVVLELDNPDGTGLAVASQLKRRQPDVELVGLAADDADDTVFAALRVGVRGVVSSAASRAEFVEIVRRAAAGQPGVGADLASRLVLRVAAQPSATETEPEPLTPRELEILSLIAKGHTNREIAARLIVAVGTVKVHIEHILAKLGAADRTEAAVRGIELGLVRNGASETGDSR